MFLKELLVAGNNNSFEPLIKNCQRFISESNGFPLFKLLPCEYNNVHKVKVRQRKKTNALTETFNAAFKDEHANIFQRAIFANGESSFEKSSDSTTEPFFVFPINEYKFMYCKEVKNSSSEHKQIFNILFEQFENNKKEATTVIADLFKFTYIKENLSEGIKLGSEIVIYNIPYYYAVRISFVDSYKNLLTSLV